eukprot:scaffold3282_cov198-Alexandrium_tamarense.AAC.38
MNDHVVDGGGYVGCEYTKIEDRNASRTTIEDVIGMYGVSLHGDDNDDEQQDHAGDDGFVDVHHHHSIMRDRKTGGRPNDRRFRGSASEAVKVHQASHAASKL